LGPAKRPKSGPGFRSFEEIEGSWDFFLAHPKQYTGYCIKGATKYCGNCNGCTSARKRELLTELGEHFCTKQRTQGLESWRKCALALGRASGQETEAVKQARNGRDGTTEIGPFRRRKDEWKMERVFVILDWTLAKGKTIEQSSPNGKMMPTEWLITATATAHMRASATMPT
jgi:hypothetical protein